MTALNGSLDEWKQGTDGKWRRDDHPEDGEIVIDPAIFPTFEDYYNKRASDPQTLEEEIQAVENARLDKLAADMATLSRR